METDCLHRKGMGQLPWVDSYVAFNGNTSGYMRSTREMAPVNQAVLTDILFKGSEVLIGSDI